MTICIAGPPAGSSGARVDLPLLKERARLVLAELGHARSELSLALVDDPEIAELNASWRSREGPTDVLAFSLLEGDHSERRGKLLGDVVIGVETAARQARARHRAFDEELARLLIHGVLHLVGYDHMEPEEERRMRAMERSLWRSLWRSCRQ